MNNSQIGVMLKLAVGNYNWCAKVVQHFISHQLAVNRPYEFWSLIDGRPVRFSLFEFQAITGLNCDPIDPEDSFEGDHTELWRQLNIPPHLGPSWEEMNVAVDKCRDLDSQTRRKVGLLYVLVVGIYGLHRNSRLPLKYAKRVIDDEAFEKVPWGRLSYMALIHSIKCLRLNGTSMSVHGCVHAMQIWAYMAVPILGERIGRQNHLIGVPLLQWDGGRTRSPIEDIIQSDKEKNNKVRVLHLLIEKDLEEIYPEFPEHEGIVDHKLHNMLRDILAGTLDESRWGVEVMSPKQTKRKTREIEVVQDKRKSKKPVSTVQHSEREERSGIEKSLLAEMRKISARLGTMEENWRSDSLRLTKLEDVVGRAENTKQDSTKDATTKDTSPKNSSSKDTSTKDASSGTGRVDGGAPVEKAPSDASWMEMFGTAPEKEQKKSAKKVEHNQPPQSVPPISFVDISGQETPPAKTPAQHLRIDVPELQNTSSGSMEKNFQMALTKYDRSRGLNEKPVLKQRQRVPPPSQISPYIGCSVVRRLLKPSYDPFEPVEPVRVMNLYDFIEADLSLEEFDPRVDLFLRIMTPKEQWKEEQFGWLSTEHMSIGMSFFRERDNQNPSPFRPRIAFIDPYFTSGWCHDYSTVFVKNEKAWTFTQGYLKLYSGYKQAKKKWVQDVDTLYICHNINDRHWIALEVDLPKRKITVYDSIVSAYEDSIIFNQCRPYARMIPLLIKQLSPAPAREKKKMSVAAFTVYRRKQIPQNIQSGDCGVYSLKYIECLALGRGFEGLSDATIRDIRLKYAADIFAERPPEGPSFSDPNPRVAEGSKDAMISGSQPVG